MNVGGNRRVGNARNINGKACGGCREVTWQRGVLSTSTVSLPGVVGSVRCTITLLVCIAVYRNVRLVLISTGGLVADVAAMGRATEPVEGPIKASR